MRLTQAEQIVIIKVIQRYFGNEVKIWLYGPRLDQDSAQRDVDLYIETSLSIVNHRHAKLASANELARLFRAKIDITSKGLIDDPEPESWLHVQARRFGKRLY